MWSTIPNIIKLATGIPSLSQSLCSDDLSPVYNITIVLVVVVVVVVVVVAAAAVAVVVVLVDVLLFLLYF